MSATPAPAPASPTVINAVNCPVCNLPFHGASDAVVPLLAACGHSICERCWDAAAADASRAPRCPVKGCYRVLLETPTRNDSLARYCAAVGRSSGGEATQGDPSAAAAAPPRCVDCWNSMESVEPATRTCETHEAGPRQLCDMHAAIHASHKHVIANSDPFHTPSHPGCLVNAFCMDDFMPVCPDCTVDHLKQGHDVQNYRAASAVFKDRLASVVAACTGLTATVDTAATIVADARAALKQQHASSVAAYASAVTALKDQLDARVVAFTRQCEELYDDYEKQLDAQHTELLVSASQLDAYVRLSRHTLDAAVVPSSPARLHAALTALTSTRAVFSARTFYGPVTPGIVALTLDTAAVLDAFDAASRIQHSELDVVATALDTHDHDAAGAGSGDGKVSL